jgi:hypothetical protein
MEIVMENTVSTSTVAQMAKDRVRQLKGFYCHLLVFTIGVVVYISKSYFGAPINFPPISYVNFTFMAIWTFIITVDGLRLFVKEKLSGTSWEKRKINQIIEQEKASKNRFE